MERRYHLQAQGATFDMLAEKEAQWLDVEPQELLRAGKKPPAGQGSRSVMLFCQRRTYDEHR